MAQDQKETSWRTGHFFCWSTSLFLDLQNSSEIKFKNKQRIRSPFLLIKRISNIFTKQGLGIISTSIECLSFVNLLLVSHTNLAIWITLKRVTTYLLATTIYHMVSPFGSFSVLSTVLKSIIECFHVTSRQPYWCPKKNETAAILLFKTNPVGVKLFSYVKTFFCSNKFVWLLATWVKTLYTTLNLAEPRTDFKYSYINN